MIYADQFREGERGRRRGMDTCKTLKPFTPKSDHSVHSTIMFMMCYEKKKKEVHDH